MEFKNQYQTTVPQDGTLVVPKPRMVLPEERRQKKIKRDKEEQQKRQQQSKQKQAELEQEKQIARNALSNKHIKEQKANELIRSDKQHAVMDQVVQPVSNPHIKSTFQKTPEQQYVQQAIPYKGSWVESVVPAVISAPILLPMAEGAALYTLSHPLAKRLVFEFAKDTAANWALNKGYTLATDRQLPQDINYVLGLDPDNMVGDLSSFSLAGGIRRKAGKALYNGLTKAFPNTMTNLHEMKLPKIEDWYYKRIFGIDDLKWDNSGTITLKKLPSVNYSLPNYKIFTEDTYRAFLNKYNNGIDPVRKGVVNLKHRLNAGGFDRIQPELEQTSKVHKNAHKSLFGSPLEEEIAHNKLVQSQGIAASDDTPFLDPHLFTIDRKEINSSVANSVFNQPSHYFPRSRYVSKDMVKVDPTEAPVVNPSEILWLLRMRGNSRFVSPKQLIEGLEDAATHEFAHKVVPATFTYPSFINRDNLPDDYLTSYGGMESVARISQLLNKAERKGWWTEGQPITAPLLQKTFNSYLKNGINNNMRLLYDNINDWNNFANFGQRFAP